MAGIVLVLFAALAVWAASPGGKAQYIGGTVSAIQQGTEGRIETADEAAFVFRNRGAAFRIPYSRIHLLEYGQKVDRRIGAAILISPIFLLSKKRKHFLTVGYNDEQGREQALVFRVDKNDVRSVLVSLEARSGRKVEYQDQEARKAGKG